MYELESYEDFKKLIAELEEKFRDEQEKDWDWGYYPGHPKLMYEALKKYVAEQFPEEDKNS